MKAATPISKTDRLMLRKMRRRDLEIFSDPEAMRFYHSTKTREQAEDWISWTLHTYT
jgi:RimJ/RimL family protein N-acetyltransferase